MSEPTILPARPDLVFRVGFAGNRTLPEDTQALDAALGNVLAVIASRLVETLRTAAPPRGGSSIARFYSSAPPTLRLVTGLAEGADTHAAHCLKQLAAPAVRKELAAVLPFDAATYRASRPPDARATFDEQLAACCYVVELDGRYVEGDPGQVPRARAYRAQSEVLLRQIDLLVAVHDARAKGRPGGTLETVRAALAFELPVLWIDPTGRNTRIVEPGSEAARLLELADVASVAGDDDWTQPLERWITKIVADPDLAPAPRAPGSRVRSIPTRPDLELLDEYFAAESVPPRGADGKQRTSLRSRCWTGFERRFRHKPEPRPDPKLEPFATFRARATSLNYHYSGLYRGAFLLNYGLAVVTVLLAGLALLLAVGHGAAGDQAHAAPKLDPFTGALVSLGIAKLALLLFIARNTHQANHERWNDRAVDYRYLAERLRTMFHLPHAGSFQPPAAAAPTYSTSAIRQSAVDWLFDALVRSASATALANLSRARGGDGKTLRIDPTAVLDHLREHWIGNQILFHDRSSDTMHGLHEWCERWVRRLNLVVVWAVVLDLVVLAAAVALGASEVHDTDAHALLARCCDFAERAHAATPWLLLAAVVLPAAVASLNGFGFQAECRRLADRSAVARELLLDHEQGTNDLAAEIVTARAAPADDPGAFSADVLRLAEHCARDLVEEVADWSVIYGNVVREP